MDHADQNDEALNSLELGLDEQFASIKSPSERQTIRELTRDIARLPLDQARVALEAGAALAGVSLRVSLEFLRAAPAAARVLETEELRSWAEIGRRIALSDIESAVSFFLAGVEDLLVIPQIAGRSSFKSACDR